MSIDGRQHNNGVYIAQPGSHHDEDIMCGVCGAEMKLHEKNEFGYTTWKNCIGDRKQRHDYYICPYLSCDWHKQAIAIQVAIKNAPSAKISAIMQEEIDEIIATKKTTKTVEK